MAKERGKTGINFNELQKIREVKVGSINTGVEIPIMTLAIEQIMISLGESCIESIDL